MKVFVKLDINLIPFLNKIRIEPYRAVIGYMSKWENSYQPKF